MCMQLATLLKRGGCKFDESNGKSRDRAPRRVFSFVIYFFIDRSSFLDNEAERVVNQLYGRNEKGIIKGMEPIQHPHSHLSAFIIIRGYLGSPDIFRGLANNKKLTLKLMFMCYY